MSSRTFFSPVRRLATRPVDRPSAGSLLWCGYLAFGLFMTVGYFWMPSADAQNIWYTALSMLTAPMILLGIRVHRPAFALPWYIFAGGQVLLLAGDMLWNYYEIILRLEAPFPSIADVFYLAGYPCLILGGALIIRIRTNKYDPGSFIDSAIVACGCGILAWVFVMQPYAHDLSLTLTERLVSIAYPLMDVLLLSVLARLLFTPGVRPPAFYFLCLAFLCMLVSDFYYAVLIIRGEYYTGHVLNAGWMLNYMLWGMAVLHPSMRTLAAPGPQYEIKLTLRRLILLAAASLLAPLTLAIQTVLDQPIDVPVAVGGCIVLFLLVLGRTNTVMRLLASALGKQETLLSREQVLRRAAAALVTAPDREDVARVAAEAVAALCGPTTTTQIRLVAHGSSDHAGVTMAHQGTAPDVATIDLQQLPQALQHALHHQDITEVLHSDQPDLWPVLNLDADTPVVVIASLLLQHQLRALLVIASPTRLTDEVTHSVSALSSQVALALESAALAEDLHQRRSEARFRSLVQNASDVIIVLNDDGVINYISPSVERMLGYAPEALLGTNAFRLLHPSDQAMVRERGAAMFQSPNEAYNLEARMRHNNGTWLHVEGVGNNLLADPNIQGIVFTVRDVSERRSFEQQLQHQAFHDALTSLPNRALFMDRLQHALNRAQRHAQPDLVAVLFLDLDRFKLVNDTLGHESGDMLLLTVADRLRTCVRQQDTLARFGGDEFTLLLEDLHDVDEAGVIAQRITDALLVPVSIEGRDIVISSSIGIATNCVAASSPTDLLRYADIAMYRAKNAGKARYELFDLSMIGTTEERLDLEQDLRRAIDHHEFQLHYQPIIELDTGAITGVEALVRWQHPQRGIVSPGLFIPLAEETGLILPLGRWVLEEACRQMQAWHTHYQGVESMSVSVNLSAKQFQQTDLVTNVAAILQQTGLPATSLKLEITESVVMEDVQTAIVKLVALKQLGVKLAVDDFGTGYSSLSYLKRFPVDDLKIDRAFVAGLGQNAEDTAIVQAIVTLAHTLGLAVTAEGVETAEIVAQLQHLGCDRAQGYYFAKPLPQAAIENVFAQHLQAAGVAARA